LDDQRHILQSLYNLDFQIEDQLIDRLSFEKLILDFFNFFLRFGNFEKV